MEKKVINAMGQKCPMPVIMLKNTIKEIQSGSLEVLIDNEISKRNIEKYCDEKKFHYITTEENKVYKVNIKVNKNIGEEKIEIENSKRNKKNIVVIDSLEMGKGDEKLGIALLKSFVYTLTELETPIDTLILYNKGVLLATENSDSLEDLKILETQGTKIEICGACTNFYGITEKVKVGNITNMLNILTIQLKADGIIKPC